METVDPARAEALREALERISGYRLSQFEGPHTMALACVSDAVKALGSSTFATTCEKQNPLTQDQILDLWEQCDTGTTSYDDVLKFAHKLITLKTEGANTPAEPVALRRVADAAREAMNASTEHYDGINVPSHLAAVLSLALDDLDAAPSPAEPPASAEDQK